MMSVGRKTGLNARALSLWVMVNLVKIAVAPPTLHIAKSVAK